MMKIIKEFFLGLVSGTLLVGMLAAFVYIMFFVL